MNIHENRKEKLREGVAEAMGISLVACEKKTQKVATMKRMMRNYAQVEGMLDVVSRRMNAIVDDCTSIAEYRVLDTVCWDSRRLLESMRVAIYKMEEGD